MPHTAILKGSFMREDLHNVSAPNGRGFEGYVYFMGWSDDSPVKIGWSIDPERRLKNFQTGFPYELQILGAIPGVTALEPEIHYLFDDERMRGEWFERSRRVSTLIEEADRDWPKLEPYQESVYLRLRKSEEWGVGSPVYQAVREDMLTREKTKGPWLFLSHPDKDVVETFVKMMSGKRLSDIMAGRAALREKGIA